jgi:hypothetical protein
MKISINMYSEIYEIDSDIMFKWNFKSIEKIKDTYFIKLSDGSQFSCHQNYWIPFIREYKINNIIS